MAMTVNNIVCLKVAKRDLESSYHTYKNRQLCEVIAVFLNLIAQSFHDTCMYQITMLCVLNCV